MMDFFFFFAKIISGKKPEVMTTISKEVKHKARDKIPTFSFSLQFEITSYIYSPNNILSGDENLEFYSRMQTFITSSLI